MPFLNCGQASLLKNIRRAEFRASDYPVHPGQLRVANQLILMGLVEFRTEKVGPENGPLEAVRLFTTDEGREMYDVIETEASLFSG